MPGPAPTLNLPTFDVAQFHHGLRESPTLSKAGLGDWLGVQNTVQHKAAVKLFYRGGRPENYRFFPKASVNAAIAKATFASLMSSTVADFDTRIGNLAVGLANWFDYKP